MSWNNLLPPGTLGRRSGSVPVQDGTRCVIASPQPGTTGIHPLPVGTPRTTIAGLNPALSCYTKDCAKPVDITDKSVIDGFLSQLGALYRASVQEGKEAARLWVDIAAKSNTPQGSFVPPSGAISVLWTPDIAPATATTLTVAGYGFTALPKNLVHFASDAGTQGVAQSGVLQANTWGLHGLFGPNTHIARAGRPISGQIKKAATHPILLNTPVGTARITPYLVHVRWEEAR